MTDKGADARVKPRYTANFLLHYAGTKVFGCSYTRNISDGGCFVETNRPLDRGTAIDVEMYVDLGDQAIPMVASAKVMWLNRTRKDAKLGMGLAFLDMDEDSRDLLDCTLGVVSGPQLPIPEES